MMSSEMSQRTTALRMLDETPLELELGGALPQLEIVYETWGHLTPERDNAILICPAFSAHCHARSSPESSKPGWWEGMIGPGLAFDTERYFVVCPSLLGGWGGTTGPRSIDPTTGEPWGSRFPVISIRDIVAVHVRLLDRLGIERLFAVAGGSLGGMEALELAVRHPRRTERAITVSATDRTRPFTAAVRHLGRRAIQLTRRQGASEEVGEEWQEGLRLAREIGTLFYRSRREFNQRFSWQPISEPGASRPTFEVESYLGRQASKVIGDFDPDAYLTLSLAMDLHDVWRGTSPREALVPVTARFLTIGVREDQLIPIDEQEGLHSLLVANGKSSLWRPVSSPIGHDFFLVETGKMTELVREFLAWDARRAARV